MKSKQTLKTIGLKRDSTSPRRAACGPQHIGMAAFVSTLLASALAAAQVGSPATSTVETSPAPATVAPSAAASTSVDSATNAVPGSAATPEAAPADVQPPPTPSESTAEAAPSAPAATPEASVDATEPPASPSESETKLKIGGGVVVYYYQPTKGSGKGDVSVFFANLVLDGQWENFRLHIEPRFRDSKLRPFFDGPAWLQEAYAGYQAGPVLIKAGKLYKRSGGLAWDNSFYGNVQVYDGLKLDPNYGLSVEGSVGEKFGLDFAAQYFVIDGRTNVSLAGRDTISIAGARRRHTFAGRLEPWFKPSAATDIRAGLSAEHFTADIPGAKDGVTRIGGDFKFAQDFGAPGKLGIWGEFVHQAGRHVVDHPATGAASEKTNYFLIGGEYAIWRLTARYNVSHADYKDARTTELLHVPGLGFTLNDHLGLLAEYVVWRQSGPGFKAPLDTSLNVTLNGHF